MISVITPTIRDEVTNLKEAMRHQSFKDFEHIIIRDKSRVGAAATRNQAIKKAKGGYLAFIDDDCIPDENWLNDLKTFMDQNPDVSACSGMVYPPKNASLITQLNYLKSMSDESTSIVEKKGPIIVDHVSCTNSMWRKEAFERLEGFDEKLMRSQDLDLGLRAVRLDMIMMAIPKAIVYHNYPSTIMESLGKSFIKGTGGAHILRKHPEYFGKKRWIIYLFPLYLLLFPVLFPFPLLLCKSGFKTHSARMFIYATLFEYLKYHLNLLGVWKGILCCGQR